MFATRAVRPATQLSNHVRRYASEAPTPKSGGNNALLFGALGVGALGGGYYFMSSGKKSAAAAGQEKQAKEPPKVFKGGDQGFIPLKLDKVEDINHNTKKFIFKFDDEKSVSGLNVASALITKHQTEEMKKPVIRPYTPVSGEGEKGHLDFIIKKYPDGPMSEHIHGMKPGDTLEMKGPIPKYQWSANKHNHIALLAGGTGITPMYQLCRAIFNNPEDKTKVTLVFGNVTEEDILLRNEFSDLELNYPDRFRLFYVLDKPPEGWTSGKGFITKDLLKTVLPGPKEDNVKVFVCGPPGLYKAISGPKNSPADQGELSGYLSELGYSKDQVFKF